MSKIISKRLILTSLAFFLALPAIAQVGNEWIRYNQQYFKIPVAKDGLYRLSYTDLQAAGFPTSADYQRIQLFHRGQEQAINIVKNNIGVTQLEPGDYIEFYGLKNTGISDAELYKPASTQPHAYYNLYSDTTAYFLTFNSLAVLGKRMDFFGDINVTNIPAETFHSDEKIKVLTTQYSTGTRYETYLQNSFFETGEGWTGDVIFKNQFIDYTIENILNPVTASGNPQLEVQVMGRADLPHGVEISVGPSTPSRILAVREFYNAAVVTITAPLNWSDIGSDGRIVVRVKALGIGAFPDLLSASYVKITYPQNFNVAGSSEKVFHLRENVDDKSYVELQNVPTSTRLFDITDPANVLRIGNPATGSLNAVIPNTSSSRKILATNTFIIPTIRKVSFRNVDPTAHDYIIISHPSLMETSGEYSNPVKAFATYRASAAGGSYDTLIMNIHQLYNQFNYGEISPLAISRFMAYMVNNGTPRYLFIIGKGLDVNLGYYRNPLAFTYHDYVPSAGMPASDIFYTAGLSGTNYEPAVSTGRITSNTPHDVAAYLNKVKEMEAKPYNDLWRKDILHLSGGINPGEPELFKVYMEEFSAIAEDFYFGGNVSSIAKNNTEIEFINISDKVNSGVNLVALFGHSSPSQNDFNIGFASAPELGYNNTGKYPMFLINGCNAGDFFTTAIRYGEDWINAASKGALGFMANTSFGYSSSLRTYSTLFYNVAYGDSLFIQKGIGDIQKEVVRRLSDLSSAVRYVTQGQQMFLLGDPAVKLFGASKPDYEINANYVYPEAYGADPITARSDSFAIKMIVRNFGIAKEDSIAVRVLRTLNDNTTTVYDSIFYPVLYRDTLTFTIHKNDNGFGNNTFTITLDPLNEINEIDKSNNMAEFSMFIPLKASRNLYPQGFSIVNTPSVNLMIQSTDILEAPRDFIIEIDTVDTFASPYKQQFVVNGKIATKEITLIPSMDTLAYYWRTKFGQQLNENESTDWSATSFTYIENGPEGWAQVHFPQYVSNETSGLVQDSSARKLRLKETVTDVSIQTFGANHPSSFTAVSIKLNQSEYNPVSLPELQCRDNTINLITFDKTTTFPYMPINVQYPDKRACGRRPEAITSFRSTEVETGTAYDLIQYISNVTAGDSVVLFSIGDAGFSSWSVTVKSKLEELGISSTQIASLQTGEPVIIFAKKGSASGSARIIKSAVAPVDEQELLGEGTITGRYVSGTMTSSVIGPAVQWQNFEAAVLVSEVPVTDQFSFDVKGITLSGSETILKTGLTGVTLDISDIDAQLYPYIQLVYNAADEINLTAPQLKEWIVAYEPAPEGVLIFNESVETKNLIEGEVWSGSYGFYNISEKEFSDSLTIQYSSYNAVLRTSEATSKKIKAPAPGQQTLFDITIDTKEKGGINDVNVFVNPKVLPEIYYDNNVLELKNYLDVEADLFNPVLDVTIDGRYVVDGDYVSSNPAIVIKLWDENPFLIKTDTAGVFIFLKYPCQTEDCGFKPIYFSRSDIQWQAATSTTDFRILFNPQNLEAGLYTLQVQARDVRNNSSGSDPYEVTFEVAEDQTFILSPPYPNPSAAIFYFPVIVTNDLLPEAILIEIINSKGETVRKEIGNDFFVGTNLIVWDAKNLPNGLYFYRVTLTRDGKSIKSAVGKLTIAR